MKHKQDTAAIIKYLLLTLFIALFIVACNSGEATDSAPNSSTATTDDAAGNTTTNQGATTNATDTGVSSASGYPGAVTDSGYPGIENETANNGYPGTAVLENAFPEPPDPERNIPAPGANLGSVGGVLIRQVGDTGFLPVTAQALYLGEVLTDSQGRQALIAQDENSPKAQLLPTGVFIFDNIEPGTYGLVIDIGFSQFPITKEDGSELLIQIEANKALDLGQVFVTLPNS